VNGNKGGRPKEPGANTVPVTTKLSDDLHARLEAVVAAKNARAAREGLGFLKVSECVRHAVQAWVAVEEGKEGIKRTSTSKGPSESEDAPPPNGSSNGSSRGDETTMRPSLPRLGRKMLRPTDGTFGVAVPQQLSPEEAARVRPGYVPASEPEVTEADIAAMLGEDGPL